MVMRLAYCVKGRAVKYINKNAKNKIAPVEPKGTILMSGDMNVFARNKTETEIGDQMFWIH